MALKASSEPKLLLQALTGSSANQHPEKHAASPLLPCQSSCTLKLITTCTATVQRHCHSILYRYLLLCHLWCFSIQVPKPRTTLCNSFPVLKQFGKTKLLLKTSYEASPKLLRLEKNKNCPPQTFIVLLRWKEEVELVDRDPPEM